MQNIGTSNQQRSLQRKQNCKIDFNPNKNKADIIDCGNVKRIAEIIRMENK
jgi:hypothetical protein